MENRKLSFLRPRVVKEDSLRGYNPPMDFDIVIIGGGLAGASLVAALAESGLRLALIERKAPPSPGADWDSRVYALTPASTAFRREPCRDWPRRRKRSGGETRRRRRWSRVVGAARRAHRGPKRELRAARRRCQFRLRAGASQYRVSMVSQRRCARLSALARPARLDSLVGTGAPRARTARAPAPGVLPARRRSGRRSSGRPGAAHPADRLSLEPHGCRSDRTGKDGAHRRRRARLAPARRAGSQSGIG